jgi:hypothetical protein
MPQTTTLKTTGLYTYPDLLGEIPAGALVAADNVVIDRDGVISPRRGLATYGDSFGSSSTTAKAMMYYKAQLFRHWNSSLDFDSDGEGTWVNMATNILEPATGVKIKFAESNGNLYFTSNKGIKKISATAASNVLSNGISFAGGIEALDGNGYLNTEQGWFLQDSQVAYRIVWGIQDSNTNVVLGIPSERIIVTNPQLSLTISDFNKLLIALDIVASSPPVVLTANSNATTTLSGLSSTSNLSVGMTVTDTTNPTNIPADTVITSIIDANDITISNAATGTFTGDSYSFGQTLNYTNFSSLSLPTDASSTELYTALQDLAQELDTNLNENIYAGLSGTITDIVPSVVITLTGNTTFSGTPSYTINNLSTTVGLANGMSVSGYGIPANTIITGITPSTPITATGNVTVSSTTISSFAVVGAGTPAVGDSITGDGIPSGTTIQSVGSGTITISQNATATNSGVALTITNSYVTLNNAITETVTNSSFTFSSPTIITSPAHGLTTGDEITISGTNSSPIIDTTNPVTVTVIDANDFSIPTITTMAGNTGRWQQYPPSVLLTYYQDLTGLLNPATTQQLTYLQNIYDGLVNNLNVDNGISANALAAIGGAFDNSTQTATTNIIFTIPSQVTEAPNGSPTQTAWFYQVYRSDMSTSIGPGFIADEVADDECRLIAEANPTAATTC